MLQIDRAFPVGWGLIFQEFNYTFLGAD